MPYIHFPCTTTTDPKTTSLPMFTQADIKEQKPPHLTSATNTKDNPKQVKTTTKQLSSAQKLNTPEQKIESLGIKFPVLATKGSNREVPFSARLTPNSLPPTSERRNNLPLVYNRHTRKKKSKYPPNAIFSQCPLPGGWFVIHPDWRQEHGIKSLW